MTEQLISLFVEEDKRANVIGHRGAAARAFATRARTPAFSSKLIAETQYPPKPGSGAIMPRSSQ